MLEPLEVLVCRSIQGSGYFLDNNGNVWPEARLPLKFPDCSPEESMSLLVYDFFRNLVREDEYGVFAPLNVSPQEVKLVSVIVGCPSQQD